MVTALDWLKQELAFIDTAYYHTLTHDPAIQAEEVVRTRIGEWLVYASPASVLQRYILNTKDRTGIGLRFIAEEHKLIVNTFYHPRTEEELHALLPEHTINSMLTAIQQGNNLGDIHELKDKRNLLWDFYTYQIYFKK